ncbi:MAG: hypothetical protein KBT27_05745 [Prevotellaceae bacterium]|nr:hypothetical protein [Candidatus Faecinaster equi]
MKQFLYLDTDIVSSIIAQAQQGLILQSTSEMAVEKGRKRKKDYGFQAKASGEGNLLKFLHAEAAFAADTHTEQSQSVNSTKREIVEKTLHDAAFDIAYEYIKPSEASEKDSDFGDYIKLKRVFTFVDFAFFQDMFAKGGVIDIVNRINSQNGKQNNKQNGKQFADSEMVIKLLNGLVPYSRMLISFDGFLVPLDDKYFRINPANLGFKYGGEITCVGLITNIIGESADPCDDKDVFANIQFSVNEILRSVLPTSSSDLCVVHPIAVYYES